jgi:hypothetical protein
MVSLSMRIGVPSLMAALLLAQPGPAQNGSNYHVLSNGADAMFQGVGAGGAQTPADGLLTYIAGEDLRGSRITPLGDFGYRQVGFAEEVCVPFFLSTGPISLKFPAIVFVELDGLNGNTPPIFTNPLCSPPSFPLGTSGFVPYGTGPGSTASFVLRRLGSSVGMPTQLMLLPNHGLQPSGAGGTATIVAAASVSLPLASTGFCWVVQFNWLPSAIMSLDDVDGWVHYVVNSPDMIQYWAFSENEQNVWQSQSVATDGGLTALKTFSANMDYALTFFDAEPVTVATLAPRAGTTPYSAWTTNVFNEFGAVLHPNGGFDVGRGSSAVSLSGIAGVPNPTTGVGNQDPSLGPGVVPTLGFATWDNGGDYNGSVRLTWVSFDVLGAGGGNPDTDPGVLVFEGTVRVPVVSSGFIQPLTLNTLGLFGHVTQLGFAMPWSPPSFPLETGGASWQLPLPAIVPCLAGTSVNLTYGTSGRTGGLGTAGGLVFDPAVAGTSGSRQLFLFD